jgi:hypothetical protein
VEFMLVTLVMIGLIIVILVLLARAYPGSGADLVDWKPTRSYEDEARLEMEDVQQMIAAQNEYRRRRGAEDISEADVNKWAQEDEKVRRQSRDYEKRLQDLEDELGA